MKTQKQRKLDDFNAKRNLKRHKASNRFFLDQDTMGEARWAAAIEHSKAKREGKKLVGVLVGVWYCPCACISSYPKEDVGAKLTKQLKGTPTRRPKLSKRRGYQPYDRTIHSRAEMIF